MKYQKIAAINLSGNVGKTTLCINLCDAFMADAKYLSVEMRNTSAADHIQSLDMEEFAAAEFKTVFREIMINDKVIVDVGSSNIFPFMDELMRYKSAIGELDLILVPTTPPEKQQKDTIATIEWLHKLGFPANKIRVVFNLYPSLDNKDMALVYSYVFGYAMADGKSKATFEPHIVVAENEVFETMQVQRKNIREIASDKTDWKAMRVEAKAAEDMDALEVAMDGQMAQDLAMTAQANLAQAAEMLFGKGNK